MSPKKKIEPVLNRNKKNALVSGVGSGVGLAFAEAYFPKATHTIRIASAYFHFEGFNLIKEKIRPKVQLRIIVRIRDGGSSSEQVRLTAVKAVEELIKQLGKCTPLVDSIRYIVEKMEKGEFFIRDAHEAEPFHAKYYVFDKSLLWHGSANLSNNGLAVNIENIGLITNKDEVQGFIYSFDTLSKNSRDLLELLKEKLKNWLELAKPFDIYLKTLFLLFKKEERKPLLEGAHEPNYFQQEIIEKALIKINKYGGVLIVAATGLGKTIIGSEIAYRMVDERNISQIILLAPSNVHKNWERENIGRRIRNVEYFDIGTPFSKTSNNDNHIINRFEKSLNYNPEETLIIIDEAHFYRNELLKQYIKEKDDSVQTRVLDLIVPAVAKGAKIVLLTATVYSTSPQNNNSLLYLLPHTAGDFGNAPWSIEKIDDFTSLSNVITLGLPDVLRMAKDKNDIDIKGRSYFQYGETRRYLPKEIILYPECFDLPLEKKLLELFDDGYFNQKVKGVQSFCAADSTEFTDGTSDTMYNSALKSWLSSQELIKLTLAQNILTEDKDPEQIAYSAQFNFSDSQKISEAIALIKDKNTPSFKGKMLHPKAKRQEQLIDTYLKLCDLKASDDKKLKRLLKIIKQKGVRQKSKILIFVNFHLTAIHIYKEICREFAGKINVACTVEEVNGVPKLCSPSIREQKLKNFSPKSNDCEPEQEYDLLICTDADGVGVNLQDADIIVNYDLPTGADELFQRVGRILRMTEDPERTVHIHTFLPSIIDKSAQNSTTQLKIYEMFDRLRKREGRSQSESLLGTKILALKKREKKIISAAEIEEILVTAEEINSLKTENSSSHMSILESPEMRKDAAKIPDYIFSARAHSALTPQVFVLFKHKEDYFPVVYDVERKTIKILEKFEALDLLKCDPNCEVASVNVERLKDSKDNGIGIIEVEVLKAAEKLHEKTNISIQDIIKVCALYLIPSKQNKPREIFGNLRKNKSK